jgi:hypothetical protein
LFVVGAASRTSASASAAIVSVVDAPVTVATAVAVGVVVAVGVEVELGMDVAVGPGGFVVSKITTSCGRVVAFSREKKLAPSREVVASMKET